MRGHSVNLWLVTLREGVYHFLDSGSNLTYDLPQGEGRVREVVNGRIAIGRESPLTCQSHQTQRTEVSLGLENAGKTSLMAAGVYQTSPLGSIRKSVSL